MPKQMDILTTKDEPKRKVLVNLSQVPESQDVIDLSRQRSSKRSLRNDAYVKRFISVCHYEAKYLNSIITGELTEVMNNLLVQEQKKFFSDGIKTLQTSPQVKK